MRADELAAYNLAHPEVLSMEEACQQAHDEAIARYRTKEVRINEPYCHDRDRADVQAGRVIYPGSELPFALAALSSELNPRQLT
jgi:hypothetical protein